MKHINNIKPIKDNSKIYLFFSKRYNSSQFNYQQIFSMLLPLILDQFFIFSIGMLTTSMISSSGQDSVAAVCLVGPITFLVMGLASAISNGGTVIVAQYKGKGDEEQMKKAAGQVVLSTFVVATILSVVLIIFADPVINTIFKGSTQAVLEKSKSYLIGNCLSFPAFAIFNGIFNALRGVGDTKTCLRLTVVINVIHLFASMYFINVLKLDILGTSISLIIARLIGGIIALYLVLSRKGILTLRLRDMFYIDFKIQKSIFKMGIPFSVEMIFFNVGRMLTQTYMVLLGTNIIAADGIASTATNLFYAMGIGVSTLAITVVGQCIGAGDISLARKYGKQFIKLGTTMIVLGVIIIYPFMPLILKLFSPQADTLILINQAILIGIIPIPFFWSLSNVMPSVLRAAGDANFTSMVSLTSMWIFRVGLAYVLALPCGLGLNGIWIAMGAEWAARSLIFGLRFKGEKWYKNKVV